MNEEYAWEIYDNARRKSTTVQEALEQLRGKVRSFILIMKILRDREGMTLAEASDLIESMPDCMDFGLQ